LYNHQITIGHRCCLSPMSHVDPIICNQVEDPVMLELSMLEPGHACCHADSMNYATKEVADCILYWRHDIVLAMTHRDHKDQAGRRGTGWLSYSPLSSPPPRSLEMGA